MRSLNIVQDFYTRGKKNVKGSERKAGREVKTACLLKKLEPAMCSAGVAGEADHPYQSSLKTAPTAVILQTFQEAELESKMGS